MATNNIGMGGCLMGATRFGFGAPATATALSGTAFQAADGTQWGSRQISTTAGTAGQYVIGSNGRAVGQNDVDQMVIIALRTVKGTAAVRDVGHTLNQQQKIGPTFQQDIAARVQAALADLINRKLITLDSVVVAESQGSRAATIVNITNLSKGIPQRFTLGGDRKP